MWQDLWAALALVLVIEGILPFINPNGMRNAWQQMVQMDDKSLRIAGLRIMESRAQLGIAGSNLYPQLQQLGGAIDSQAAAKAARFLQLCDAFELPVLSLTDTPGYMVGIDSEREGAVRRMSRLLVAGASISVPLVNIILRKAYGLAGSAHPGKEYWCQSKKTAKGFNIFGEPIDHFKKA